MLYYLVSSQVDGYMHICKDGAIYFSEEVNKDEIINFDNLSTLLKYLEKNKFFNLGPLLIDEEISETIIYSDEISEEIEEIDTIQEENINTGKKKKTIKKTTKKRKK
jgi:hypothetical protein